MAGTSEALAQRCAGERMNFALPKVWQLSCLEKLVQLCPGVIKESQGQAVWDIPRALRACNRTQSWRYGLQNGMLPCPVPDNL